MNLLAFSLHSASEMAEELWRSARSVSGTRIMLFNVMNSLTAYIVFPDWLSLMRMITTGMPPPTA